MTKEVRGGEGICRTGREGSFFKTSLAEMTHLAHGLKENGSQIILALIGPVG